MRLEINPENPEPRKIRRAVEALEAGEVIAYPTDTVYGLGCDLFNKKAVDRLYQIKGLNADKKLAFVCSDLGDVARYAVMHDNVYRVLKAADPRARRTDFTDGTRPGFREPLFLLAVVCGHPRAAKRFFKELAKASGTIDGLELAASPQRVAETPDDEAWGVFTQAFDRFSAPMDDSLSVARLNDWLPAIKRFDYRDWRHLGA